MEVVFVQLSDKACEIAMLEVFGQNGFSEPFVLRLYERAHENTRLLDPQVPRGRRNYHLRPPIGRPVSMRDLLTFFRSYQQPFNWEVLFYRASYLYSLRTFSASVYDQCFGEGGVQGYAQNHWSCLRPRRRPLDSHPYRQRHSKPHTVAGCGEGSGRTGVDGGRLVLL